jgi:hypothetical protein
MSTKDEETMVGRSLEGLEGAKTRGDTYAALSTGYDKNPTSRISEGEDGRSLVKRSIDCTVNQALTALIFEVRDLNVPNEYRNRTLYLGLVIDSDNEGHLRLWDKIRAEIQARSEIEALSERYHLAVVSLGEA